jgi:hypothetical protein
MKRPSFQFYPSDWLRDTALRACSISARGLWIDMISFMHECKPYGHLKLNGNPVDKAMLARMVGIPLGECETLISELEESGVLSIDPDGAFYCRRMLKDEKLREIRANAGSLGGNPALGSEYNIPGFVYLMRRKNGHCKIGISQSPDKRAYRLRKVLEDDSIKVVAKYWVTDMGATEADLHKRYKQYQHKGEWFELPPEAVEEIVNSDFHHKVNQTPSSSSSPSSSKFVPPSVHQVQEYGHSLKPPFSDAVKFVNFYESKGWKVGKNPMKNWQAAVRNWNSKNDEKTTSTGTRPLF